MELTVPVRRKTAPVSLRRAQHKYTYARIEALIAIHGDTTEGKRRAAKELGIGLSTLYRLLAKQTREKRREKFSPIEKNDT